MTMGIPTDSDTWAAALAPPTREEDEAHRQRVHAEIIRDLSCCLIGEYAGAERLCVYDEDGNEFGWGAIVDAIAAGRIRHLKVIY